MSFSPLTKIPADSINAVCKVMSDQLWEISGKTDRNIAVAIGIFEVNLRDFIIRELFETGIVEEKETK